MQAALNKSLKTRAQIYREIRDFFTARDVLEVETPLLCSHTVTDVHVAGIEASGRFLQTSPEYCMKRLLSQGSGPIFQICKAFREEEAGSYHNPEFTMLEWYRPGFDHHALMNELDTLIQTLLNTLPATKQSYQECFLQHTGIDPLDCELKTLHDFIVQHQLLHAINAIDFDTATQVILSEYIEPHIGQQQPFFLYDFPASQAALARINGNVGARFELYYKGLELANGFHELTDATEQLQRFQQDQAKRKQLHLPHRDIDMFFIDALKQGLPDCAGVAVGLDRIIMLACNANTIQSVLGFSWGFC